MSVGVLLLSSTAFVQALLAAASAFCAVFIAAWEASPAFIAFLAVSAAFLASSAVFLATSAYYSAASESSFAFSQAASHSASSVLVCLQSFGGLY